MTTTLLAGELATGHEVRPPGATGWLPVKGIQPMRPGSYDAVLHAGDRQFTTTMMTPWPARDAEVSK